jgi:hypothetical protein
MNNFLATCGSEIILREFKLWEQRPYGQLQWFIGIDGANLQRIFDQSYQNWADMLWQGICVK